MVRQRSPQSFRYRFLRFQARELPCMAHKRQKHCLQLIPDVFMHRQLAQLRLSSEKEQFCHHFDVSPYWSRWLTPRDFQWDLVDIFEMTNVSGFLFSKKCSNFFLKPNFWSRFFSNICAVWFPVDWACFWINPGLQKSSISIFVRGGATLTLAPPLVEISDGPL